MILIDSSISLRTSDLRIHKIQFKFFLTRMSLHTTMLEVFYSVDGSDVVDENTFVAFPGYDNLDPNGNPIMVKKFVEDLMLRSVKSISSLKEPRMEQFREYKFNNSQLDRSHPSELRSSEHQPTHSCSTV